VSSEKDAVAEVHDARNSAITVFNRKWESMRENSKFLRLNQYSEKQLAKMKEQKRVPYVLDYINAAVNTFQGIQRDKRTEIFYYGVEAKDEMRVEVLNALKESAFQVNNFIYTESDIFQDGLVMKVGGLGYEWSRETNKNGALKLFRIPPEQLMWDANSMEFDHSDATWVSRHRMFSKLDLINRRPEMKEEIEKMSWFADGEMSIDNVTSAYLDSILDEVSSEPGLAFDRKPIRRSSAASHRRSTRGGFADRRTASGAVALWLAPHAGEPELIYREV